MVNAQSFNFFFESSLKSLCRVKRIDAKVTCFIINHLFVMTSFNMVFHKPSEYSMTFTCIFFIHATVSDLGRWPIVMFVT